MGASFYNATNFQYALILHSVKSVMRQMTWLIDLVQYPGQWQRADYIIASLFTVKVKCQNIQYWKYWKLKVLKIYRSLSCWCTEKGQQVAVLLSSCIDIFLIFLPFFLLVEDLESHDGSAERPYYMSKSLLKILNKRKM